MEQEHPFKVHQNDRFEKLCQYLISKGLAEFSALEDSKGRKISFKGNGKEVVFEFIYFSLLAHGGFTFDNQKLGIKLPGKGFSICINPNKSKEYLKDLISAGERESFMSRPEEFFNSSLAIYLGSLFEFEFIYPNTYIVELGKKTHELDIFGCINYENVRKYLLVETTLGYFKKQSDDGTHTYDSDSHNWHFKKAIFKKWALERIFNVNINLLYVTIRELLSPNDDQFIQALLSKEINIKIVHFLPVKDAFIDISPNSDFTLEPLQDTLDSLKKELEGLLAFSKADSEAN